MSLVVLIIDDDKAVQFFHRIMLAQSCITELPLVFNNGSEALQYLEEHFIEQDEYLLLLDINMPQMNGWELLDHISEKNYSSQVYVVMVTSSVDKADHEKAMSYKNVLSLVEKPLSEESCQLIANYAAIACYLPS